MLIIITLKQEDENYCDTQNMMWKDDHSDGMVNMASVLCGKGASEEDERSESRMVQMMQENVRKE
jgi:tryptophanase